MKKRFIYIIDIILFIVLVYLDQLSKSVAVSKLKDHSAFVIWDKVFEFNYLENRGAAFGMLQNQKIFFVFVALIFMLAIVYVLAKCPSEKRYYSLHILLVSICAGALGNMIDRLNHDYVVDFIYFKLINFPIFNVADIYVTVSTFILIIMILFVYRDTDFEFISFKKSGIKEIRK